MSFTINEPCDITFDFNSKTRITTITGTPAEAITNIATEESAPIDFDGYSVIGTQELTRYNWLQSGSELAADGSLDLSYGANDSEENYEITLTKTADVEITFNKDKGTISVKTSPTGALDSKVYVVTGTEDLMGKAWDITEAVMTFNEEEGVYEYTRQGVYSNANYAFKVIEQGIDSGNNISFYLGGAKDTYNLRFTYNPKNGVTAKYAYDVDSGDDVTAAVMEAVQITSYSVLGDKGLTGSSWLGLPF